MSETYSAVKLQNWQQVKAPKNGWLEDDPASFLGVKRPIFRGFHLLLCFREGEKKSLWIIMPIGASESLCF